MNRNNRDGFQGDRLFLKKMKEVGLNIIDYGFFRDNVIWIKTSAGKYVLKGFHREETCKKQIMISDLYISQKPRIMGTYTRFQNNKRYIHFGEYFWAIMPFYKGDGLHFGNQKDVIAGIDAISRFHSFSKSIPSDVYNSIPSYSLYKKWSERYNTFKYNARRAKWSKEMQPLVPDILMWGSWCLEHFDHSAVESLEQQAYKRREITHGDVAPHNFVLNRGNSKEAYLIDFDLFAAVPQAYDWLQYANRILPFWFWSYSKMEEMGNKDYLQWFSKKWFVICLVFPTDLYREWNRAIKSGDKELIKSVERFTLRDYSYRKKFVDRIINMIK
ncbi:phosphotransferase [Fictibacillus phosphorivorans]|uniref:phosphotransferase n=1 Tax=Fictibacillus phosphorivorans TaxID=1221500 RepID=UPI00203A47BA|nr:phosphotransferase [Fictibacillus phosphorivorans]MCM3716992.1 phosphotransferase [Fictibacillus phosphorivorans]MCM3774459.1 phosphotransferase [Fictibacillus phosphorivorans]